MNSLDEITLTIRSEVGQVLAVLRWKDGDTTVSDVDPGLSRTIEDWIEYGLDEWLGEGDDAEQRHTPSTSPQFLERLEDYLARQFHFRNSLKTREVTAMPVTISEQSWQFLGKADMATRVAGAIHFDSSSNLILISGERLGGGMRNNVHLQEFVKAIDTSAPQLVTVH